MRSSALRSRNGLYLPEHQLDMSLAEQRSMFLPYIDTLTKAERDRLFPSIGGASGITGTWGELLYSNRLSFGARASFTTEIALNDTATEAQGKIPADFFLPGQYPKSLRFVARGILSSTATPTYTFTLRPGAAASITAVIALGSAALTTGTTVTNQLWEFEGDVTIRTLGTTGATGTGNGLGMLVSGGLASPFSYALFGGAASPGTFTTFDSNIANFINFNAACSASSASNTITLLQLFCFGLN